MRKLNKEEFKLFSEGYILGTEQEDRHIVMRILFSMPYGARMNLINRIIEVAPYWDKPIKKKKVKK